MSSRFVRTCAFTLWVALLLLGARNSEAADDPTSTYSWGDLSLEDLLNLRVTSVSKKSERLNDAAAAIYVLSNDDLRRAGVTTIAEALRLVPGMNVGQINSSQWAISSRGFNGQYANKLLVMVDGRVVYTPLYSGVFWDMQQMMLEDVDRIEVIRGPGSTIWGANAVNGVINVVTRSARDSQGGLVYASGGNVHWTMDGARYGGQVGKHTYYRVFGNFQMSDEYMQPTGPPAVDDWQSGGGGFRLDHYPDPSTHLTWQADATFVDLNHHRADAYNVNTLARMRREFPNRTSVEAQAYYDRTFRNDPIRARTAIDTVDLTLQHTFHLGRRNEVIWGMGYRLIINHTDETTPTAIVRDGDFNMHILNVFLQDEFHLVPDKLLLTAGTKVEHNDITGFELQPSFRAVFKPTLSQTLWAAVSRAVRTPSELEGKDVFAFPISDPIPLPDGEYIPVLVADGTAVSEILWAYELGYRVQPVRRVNLDVALFYNRYDRLVSAGVAPINTIPGNPGFIEVRWENLQSGITYGGEAALTIEPIYHWRLTASYSHLAEDITPPLSPLVQPITDPKHQVKLRSALDYKRASLDIQLRYVNQTVRLPAYTTADVRLSYRPIDSLELSLVGQNLFEKTHREDTQPIGIIKGMVPRGFYGKAMWRF